MIVMSVTVMSAVVAAGVGSMMLLLHDGTTAASVHVLVGCQVVVG